MLQKLSISDKCYSFYSSNYPDLFLHNLSDSKLLGYRPNRVECETNKVKILIE